MEIRIVKGFDKEWDTFVDNSNNGTIFHKLKFLSYHSKKSFDFLNLSIYQKNRLLAVIPGGLTDNFTFTSPIGASYGSYVTNCTTLSDYEEMVECTLHFLKKQQIKKIVITPSPIFYNKIFHQLEDYLFIYKNFTLKHHLITHAVNLKLFNNTSDILPNIHKNYRNAISQAIKNNVNINFSDRYREFYRILVQNKKKFDAKPTHSYKEILKLVRLFPKNIKLLVATNNSDEIIASVLVFITNNHSLLTFYICQNYQYQELRPVNLLLYKLMEWAVKNNFNWLDLGVSMDTASSNPMEPSRNLIFFKEGILSTGFLRSTYYLDL